MAERDPQDALAYDRAGAGPLLVAIHGITENRTFWDRVPLSESFDVIRVDLRGHGESPVSGPCDPDSSAEDIHRLLSGLGVTAAPWLVGHSFGGLIATIYASRHLSAGVVNVDQPLQVSPLAPPVRDTVREGDLDGLIATMMGDFYGDLDPSIAADLTRRRVVRREVLLENWSPLLELDADALERWMAQSMSLAPGLPYLSWHGRDPGEAYGAWLASRIPDASVELAPTRTHYPHLADPDVFLERLQAFIRDSASPA